VKKRKVQKVIQREAKRKEAVALKASGSKFLKWLLKS
jgi:hypothetical protein